MTLRTPKTGVLVTTHCPRACDAVLHNLLVRAELSRTWQKFGKPLSTPCPTMPHLAPPCHTLPHHAPPTPASKAHFCHCTKGPSGALNSTATGDDSMKLFNPFLGWVSFWCLHLCIVHGTSFCLYASLNYAGPVFCLPNASLDNAQSFLFALMHP